MSKVSPTADRRHFAIEDPFARFGLRYVPAMTPLATAVVAALYPGSAALAQEQDEAAQRGLEEIVVTATRRETSLQDVPQSITALSTADIQRQAFQNMEDYMKALPSMNLVNMMPGRNSVIMRGVSTGSAEYRTDSQVAVYLDEQPMTSISQQVDVRMVDIARIESLPGPQGTLFGSSSQSGTLRIITNKPDPSGFAAQVEALVGTTKGGEESYDLNGWINIPLIDDKLAIRAVGFTAVEGGYVDNVLGMDLAGIGNNADVVEEDWNDYEVNGGRLEALWTISDEWDLLASAIAQNSFATGTWFSDTALGDYAVTRFFDEYREDDWYQTSMTLTGDLGFAELSLTASDFNRDINYEWDNMYYEQWRTAYYGPYYPLYDTDYTNGTIFNWQGQERYSFEARLTSTTDSRLQWMVGAFYEKVYDWWFTGALDPELTTTDAWEAAQAYAYYYANLGYDVEYPLPATDIYYQNTYDKKIKQTAVFGEVTWSLTDNWEVTGGLRWFEYDRKELNIYEVPLGLPIAGSVDIDGVQTSEGVANDTVLKFATQYHLDDDRMVYLLYSEGFRLGGNNSLRAASTGLIPASYGPDTLTNYEGGLKSEWLDNRLQLNVSLFHMVWDDIQINDRAENGPFWARGTVNAGKAQSTGAEIAATWYATDNLLLEASAFLAEPEFSETFVKQDGDTIEKGMTMPNSPERKYWAAVQYTIPSIEMIDGELWFRYDTSYQSETINSLANVVQRDPTGVVPSWTTSNFQVGLDLESGWQVSLMVRNVWDERNVNTLFTPLYGEFFGDPRFNRVVSLQKPRTIGLTLRKTF
ncbi:MAG TPA: TonB-dependent receptor [Woeseiaceae bacterium]|nr:TonB-dependent receptor [Woeseiaceae bacterium]